MDGSPNGGVFSPQNLGLYTYTANNPVNMVDPDGNSVEFKPTAVLGIRTHSAAAAYFGAQGHRTEMTLDIPIADTGRADLVVGDGDKRAVWELKPISYRKAGSAKHASALKQVERYRDLGQKKFPKESWSTGTKGGVKAPLKGTLKLPVSDGIKNYTASIFIPEGKESEGIMYYTLHDDGFTEEAKNAAAIAAGAAIGIGTALAPEVTIPAVLLGGAAATP